VLFRQRIHARIGNEKIGRGFVKNEMSEEKERAKFLLPDFFSTD
jgi:hypothetical protein